jgi:hypothetical protein
MHLFDPQRNFLPNGHKTWLRGDVAIKNPTVRPLQNGNIELSMFLPIREEIFTSKEFKIEITPQELITKLEDFAEDPENFVETHFTSTNRGLLPEVRKTAPQKLSTNTNTNTSTRQNTNQPKLRNLSL